MTKSLTLGSNIDGLSTQRHLETTGQTLSTLYERLSSGSRISSTSDDVAGVSLATNLELRAGAVKVGEQSASDGISTLNTANNALTALSGIVTSQLQLAAQAADGTATPAQRAALDTQVDALTNEYNRVVRTSIYNRTRVLDGYSPSILLQADKAKLDVPIANISVSNFVNQTALDLTSITGANSATTYLMQAAATLATAQTTVQGSLAQVGSALNTLTTTAPIIDQATHYIVDPDIAQDVADVAHQRIRQQLGTAIVAQANLQPQVVKRLLDDSFVF